MKKIEDISWMVRFRELDSIVQLLHMKLDRREEAQKSL